MEDNKWMEIVLERIEKDLDEIKREVKELNRFMYRVLGASAIVSSVITLIIQLFLGVHK